MKKAKKIDLPLLKDVVVPGREMPSKGELPSILGEIQERALQQQIEKIIKKQLDKEFSQVTQKTIKAINEYLEKNLPTLLKEANKSLNEQKEE